MKCIVVRYPKNVITDVLLSLLCAFIIILILQNGETVGVVADHAESSSIAVRFLAENGLNVVVGSEKTELISIPVVFDDTFKEYNEIQKKQGFDLQDFAGRQVLKCSYELSDYLQNAEDIYFATVYLYNNEIIAADIYSSSVSGFMTGVL